MGIGTGFIQRLLNMRQLGNLNEIASVAEIGNQQLSHGVLLHPTTLAFLRAFGAEAIDTDILDGSQDQLAHGSVRHQDSNQPNSRILWHAIGAQYVGFDMDDDPDTVKLDLNFGHVPEDHMSKYDLVTNLGTTEHVLNQFNAFKVTHDLCRPGGLIIHELPGGGYANHGFFSYNPKFFWHLAKANNYQLVDLSVGVGASYRLLESVSQSDQLRSPLPWAIRDLFGHDVGLSVIFAKRHDEPFRTPLDVGDFGQDPHSDPDMRETYPSYFSAPDFWASKHSYGPKFKAIFPYLADHSLALAVARMLGGDCEDRLLSIRVPSEPNEPQPVQIGRYLDAVNTLLLDTYRSSNPASLTATEIDLCSSQFMGLEWGHRVAGPHGQQGRLIGPRGESAVMVPLNEGNDYDIAWRVLEIHGNASDNLAVIGNGKRLGSRFDGSHLRARLPASHFSSGAGPVRIGITANDAASRFQPWTRCTESAGNGAVLSLLTVAVAQN